MKRTMIITVALLAAVNLAGGQNKDCSNQVVNRILANSFGGFLKATDVFRCAKHSRTSGRRDGPDRRSRIRHFSPP